MNYRKRMAQVLENEQSLDGQGRVLNLLLILLISLNVIAIFLESVDSIYREYQRLFMFFELFSVGVFTIEYIARVWSSIDLDSANDSSPIVGRIKYMLTPIALVDLIAILPFYLSLYLSIDLRFLRVLRLLRLLKLARYSPALGALLDVVKKEADALIAAFIVLLMMLVLAAAGIYLLENDLQPETFGSMPDSMWWAIVTLTTVGYGDVVPITTLGKVFSGVVGLIGIGMIALPAAILASGFAENIQARKHKYNQVVRTFLKDGVIDEEERRQLETLRLELDLDTEESLQVLHTVIQDIRQQSPAECPHCGKHLHHDHGRTATGPDSQSAEATPEK